MALPESVDSMDAAAILEDLNRNFGEQEKAGTDGHPFFDKYLDDNLIFRRASGMVVGKQEFLEALGAPGNVSKVLTTTVSTVEVRGSRALVVAMVHLEGIRGGKHVDAIFQNIRLFVNQGDWKCVMWFNRRANSDEAF